MVLMRDKQTGVVREVSERWLERWPDDYEPVSPGAERHVEVKLVGNPELIAAYAAVPTQTKGRRRPAKTATAEPNNNTGGSTEGETS